MDNSTIQLTCTGLFGPWWTEHDYSLRMYVYRSVWTMMDRKWLYFYVCTCTGPFGPWWTEHDYTFTYVRVPVRLDHDGPNMIILYVCTCPVRLDHDGPKMIVLLLMYVCRSIWTMMDRKWLFFYLCACTCPFGPWWTEHDFCLLMCVYLSVWTMMDQIWLFFYVCTCTGLFGPGQNMIIFLIGKYGKGF